MKDHWTAAPPKVRANLERLRDHSSPGRDIPAAAGWSRLIDAAFAKGYRVDVADIPTPATDELQRLTAAAKDDPQAAELLRRRRLQLLKDARAEDRAVVRAKALEEWAKGPNTEELQKQAKARVEAEKREAAIEAKAAEILAANQKKALEAARKQAAKELA